MDAILWIVLGIALAIAEAFTAALLIIFFAVGAIAAAGAAALGGNFLVQVIVFAVVSGISAFGLRPIVLRHARPAIETGDLPIGLEALANSHGTVLEEVDGHHGMIKIDGEVWQARSFDGAEKYLPGEHVRILKVDGATAIVWRDDMPLM